MELIRLAGIACWLGSRPASEIAFCPQKPSSPSTMKFHRKNSSADRVFCLPIRPPHRQKAAKFRHFPPFSKLFHVEQLAVPRIPQPKYQSAPKTTPQTHPAARPPTFTVNTVRTVKREETARRRPLLNRRSGCIYNQETCKVLAAWRRASTDCKGL